MRRTRWEFNTSVMENCNMINVNEVQKIIKYLILFRDSNKYKTFSHGKYNLYKSSFSTGVVQVGYKTDEKPYGSVIIRLSNSVDDESFVISTGTHNFTYHTNGEYSISEYLFDIGNKRTLHRSSASDLEDDKFQYRTIFKPDIIDFPNLSIERCTILMFYHLMLKCSTELLEILKNEFSN